MVPSLPGTRRSTEASSAIRAAAWHLIHLVLSEHLLALYDRVLTQEEIKARYQLATGLAPDAGTHASPPNAFTFGCTLAPSTAASGVGLLTLLSMLAFMLRRQGR